MSSASSNHYKSNLRDLMFNLFEFHEVGTRVLGQGPFQALDEDAARHAITQMEKLAVTELSASFADTDRRGVELQADGTVPLPEKLKASMQVFLDNDWHMLEMPEHLGGMAAPPSLPGIRLLRVHQWLMHSRSTQTACGLMPAQVRKILPSCRQKMNWLLWVW